MKTPRQFYTELRPEGLAKRKNKANTKKELSYLKKIIPNNSRILDIGCGYGRFTIPLAKAGYQIEGLDITPVLITKARALAKKARLNIKFKIGDMRKLPYDKDNFNVIICMWSVFIELLTKKDQLRALKEMLKVLRKKGFAIIEMPLPLGKSIETGKDRIIIKKNIARWFIDGVEARPAYQQNKKTLKNLMKILKVKKFKIFIDSFGGRNRLFLQFWK